MKIGIDTFACNVGISGVGVYITQILKRIPPSGANYELFGWDFDRLFFTDLSEKIEFIAQGRISGKTANALWHIFKFPNFALSRQYEVCFFPAAHRRLPREYPCLSVGTVHDMAAYWGNGKTREHLGSVLRLVIKDSLRNLDRIIAVSEFVKRELIEVINVSESRIEVVPNGVDGSVFFPRPAGSPNESRTPRAFKSFGFTPPYILYASRLHHPIKNHVNLIKAFEMFKEETGFPHKMVFAGSDDRGADKIREAALNSKYRNFIFFTGNYPSDDLPELYAAADFVVIPSYHEGFGQGVIEAMASGIPVACARAASLPETAGDAALYFDPADAEDMACKMTALATDSGLYEKCRLSGIERAKLFSWDACAEHTIKIIREII